MKKFIRVEKTKRGFPALWECGGGYTNTGEATIIASPRGGSKRALYIRRRGELANSQHALIPVAVGDYIVEAYHHRKNFEIEIYKILDFEEETAVVEQVNRFIMGKWNAELPTFLEAAVEAAMQKATCYHCRKPYFIKND